MKIFHSMALNNRTPEQIESNRKNHHSRIKEIEKEINETAMIAAEGLHDQFSAFMKVGFSRPEAFRLIQTMIANSLKGGNING